MKQRAIWTLTVSLLAILVFQGFQCGSPEFTGAKVYIQQKNFTEAIRLLEIETQNNPGNEEAWFLLGQLQSEQGNYIKMNEAFTKALELDKKHAVDIKAIRFNRWAVHLNNGVGALQKGSEDSVQYFDAAIEQFTRASEAWPDTMITYRYLGYAYNNKGDEEAAISAFKTAWARGKDTESYKQGGRIYLNRGKVLKREFEAENADKIGAFKNVKNLEKRMPKGDVMRLLGPPDSKKDGGRRSTKETWSYTTYMLEVVFDKDRVESFSQTGTYNPDIDSTKYNQAQVEFGNAVSMFEEVKRVNPKDNDNLNLLLDAYVQADKLEEAIEGFAQAVNNEPTNKVNHYILGVLKRSTGKYQLAVNSFQQALAIDSAYTDALFDLGATYYNWGVDVIKQAQDAGTESDEYKEKFQNALPYLEKVSQLKSDDPAVWETLGTIYARLGDADKAINALDKADQIRKGN